MIAPLIRGARELDRAMIAALALAGAPVMAAPEENVTLRKQKKMAQAALRYLNTSKDERLKGYLEVNFDIVAVTFVG